MRASQISIEDIELALDLKEKGETWKFIGHVLAIRRGRSMPFLGTSIANRVRPFMTTKEK